jgi:hypothetical protein
MRKLLCRLFGHRGATVSVINMTATNLSYGHHYHSHDYCEFCRQEYPPVVLL